MGKRRESKQRKELKKEEEKERERAKETWQTPKITISVNTSACIFSSRARPAPPSEGIIMRRPDATVQGGGGG